MRRYAALWLIVTAAAGCATGPLARQQPAGFSGTPSAEQLIAHLNQNCRSIQSLDYGRVNIRAKQGLQTLAVDGMLSYQKPRNFRLVAEAVGSTQADVGSNDKEFWFWFKQDNPPTLYHCSYDEFPQCKNLRLPIHPDWIAEAMCVQEFGPPGKYQMRVVNGLAEFVSQTQTPQGVPLQKVTLVALSGPNAGLVVGHKVRTAQGQEVWSAEVTEYQKVAGHSVQLKLDDAAVNTLVAGRTGERFVRPRGYQELDLARGGFSTQSIQRVRGASPDR
jgi:hypothetical protein